jgi:hypothetical protein
VPQLQQPARHTPWATSCRNPWAASSRNARATSSESAHQSTRVAGGAFHGQHWNVLGVGAFSL